MLMGKNLKGIGKKIKQAVKERSRMPLVIDTREIG
jgi:hypothetical protein